MTRRNAVLFRFLLPLFACLLFAIPSTAADVVYAEYFFDTDPGQGNGTSISLTAGGDVSLNFTANTSGLSEGIHFFYVRFQDSDGAWGIGHSKKIVITNRLSTETAPVVQEIRWVSMETELRQMSIPIPASPQQKTIRFRLMHHCQNSRQAAIHSSPGQLTRTAIQVR